MYFKVPYINNFTYILECICTSIAKGQMHISRPAWVIIVLCSNPSYYTGQRVSLCSSHCTAISTAVRRENLLVSSSLPSRNCLVSISSAINFSEKQVLSSFPLPSSFSSLFKSTRMGTVVVWSCAMLRTGLRSGVLKSWLRFMGCVRLSFSLTPAHFPLGMQPRDGKGTVNNRNSPWWLPADGVCRGHAFLHLDQLLFLMFANFFSSPFSKRTAAVSKISSNLQNAHFYPESFNTLFCVLQLLNAPVSRRKYYRARGYLQTRQMMFFFHQLS